MSILKNLFSGAASQLISSVGGVIDNLHVSDDEKSAAKLAIGETVLSALSNLAQVQGDVIKTEMKGNFLQRSWRPMLMLTFGALLVMTWLGLSDTGLPAALQLELMSIIKIGVGGYVVGRSVEKTAAVLTANVDMPFLRKKDRVK